MPGGGLDLSGLGIGAPAPQGPQAPRHQDPDDEDKPET